MQNVCNLQIVSREFKYSDIIFLHVVLEKVLLCVRSHQTLIRLHPC